MQVLKYPTSRVLSGTKMLPRQWNYENCCERYLQQQVREKKKQMYQRVFVCCSYCLCQ
jgi:hypothetical protein